MISVVAWLMTVCGVALVILGGYFVLARPPLLPRDARYMGSPAGQILEAIPGLAMWLRRVCWVMGGYIVTTGVLVLYVAILASGLATPAPSAHWRWPAQHRSGR